MLITALICSAGLWSTQAVTPQKLALLVGTGPYHTIHEDQNHLDFSDDRNVDLVSDALASTNLVPAQNQIKLKGSAATRARILDGLQQLEREAKPGSVVMIYLSGSTTRVSRSDRSAGWSRGAAAFVPFGSAEEGARNGLILEDDLQDVIGALDAKGVAQVFVVLDASNAGSIRLPPTKSAQCIYLGATEVNEETQANTLEGGFFTITLCRSLQAVSREPGSTYADFVARIRTQLPEIVLGIPQHIVASGDIRASLFGRGVHFEPSGHAFEFRCRTEIPPHYHFGGKVPEPQGEVTAPVQIVEDVECKLRAGSLLLSRDGTEYRVFGRTSQMSSTDALYDVGIWDHRKELKAPEAFPFQDGKLCLLRPTESGKAELKPTILRLVGQDSDPPQLGWLLSPDFAPGRALRQLVEKLPIEVHDGSAASDDLTMTLPMDSDGNTIRTDRINLYRNSDDSLLAHADLGDVSSAQVDKTFVSAVKSAVEWSALERLDNPVTAGALQIRLVPVTERRDKGVVSVEKLLTTRLDNGRPIEFIGRSSFAIEVRATTPWPPYVQIVDLNPGGRMDVLWPPPRIESPKFPADGNWYLLGTKGEGIKEGEWKSKSANIAIFDSDPDFDGAGHEVLRVFATKEKIDFAPILSPPTEVSRALGCADSDTLKDYDETWATSEIGFTVINPKIDAASPALRILAAGAENPRLKELGSVMASGQFSRAIKSSLVLVGARATKQAILNYLVGPCRQAGTDDLLCLAIDAKVVSTNQGPAIVPPGANPNRPDEFLAVRELKIALSTVPAQHRILLMNLHGEELAKYDARMMLTDIDPFASTGMLYLAEDDLARQSMPLFPSRVIERINSSAGESASNFASWLSAQLSGKDSLLISHFAGRDFRFPKIETPMLCNPDPIQERGGSRQPGQKQPPTAWKPGTNYALIVANDTYDTLEKLTYPESDATKLEKLLEDRYAFKVRILKHQSKASIAAAIRSYADPKAYTINPQDQLFVFFAGHGAFDRVFKEGLICVPESKGDVDQDPAFEHYLQYSTLNTLLNGLPFGHVCLALDVCFGGSFASSVAPARFDEPADGPSIGNICHVVAMSGDREVPDASPFTNHLLDWLFSRPLAKPTFFESIDDPDFESLTPHPSLTYFGKNVRGGKFVLLPVK